MFDNYGGNNRATQPQPPPAPARVLRFDKTFVRSTSGILKLIAILCNMMGFICIKVATSAWFSAILYNLVYWVGNIVTLFLFLMYLFHFVEKFDKLPWLKLEFMFCTLMVLAYIGCSIFATTVGESSGYAAGFFGFCAVIVYGMDGYLKFKAYKRGLPPQ